MFPQNDCHKTKSTVNSKKALIVSVTHNLSAFTLIELLVVVLIIGILAAIAVPQYQNAVEKSRATQALTLLKSIVQAQDAYYMVNGDYASRFDELSIDMPWTGNTRFVTTSAADSKSNADWVVGIQKSNNNNYMNVYLARISGKYKGAGFIWVYRTLTSGMRTQEMLCFERTTGASPLFDTALPAGAYCARLFSGTLVGGTTGRYYSIPQ